MLILKYISMRINIISKEKYKGREILVRNIWIYWEYLFINNGKIFSAFVILKPRLKERILVWLRRKQFFYNKREQEGAVKLLTMMAKTTIDYLDKQGKKVKSIPEEQADRLAAEKIKQTLNAGSNRDRRTKQGEN